LNLLDPSHTLGKRGRERERYTVTQFVVVMMERPWHWWW